jgi:A/G-specific adenine glycosylase
MSPAGEFATRLVGWQRVHGRSHLPWQGTRDPYRVWLSEIMLQQTQVGAVVGYYARFLERFPDVRALAQAPLDDVLGLWSGLGYYSRARNLHLCAQQVMLRHGGAFPGSAATLRELPGIGPSTAAAIASFCFGERVSILDGNVRRVLGRLLAFEGDLARPAAERELLEVATGLLPDRAADMPAYTQGLMDLGATLCLPRRPACDGCPVAGLCQARAQGRQLDFPVRTRKLKRTAQSLWLLQARTGDGAVWLEKRPAPGVWGGLYCLPVFDSREALAAALPAAARRRLEDGLAFVHVLTHKDLHLHPVAVRLDALARGADGAWFAADRWPQLGLPAPIRKLLAAA